MIYLALGYWFVTTFAAYGSVHTAAEEWGFQDPIVANVSCKLHFAAFVGWALVPALLCMKFGRWLTK